MKGLILSGGTGSRLQPVTYTRAKQLLTIANKPILFYAIEAMVKADITDIGMIVGHTKDEMIDTVGDGSRWGVSIHYIHQETPDGLAHAVKVAQPFLQDDPFLMYLGDNIIRDDLGDFIKTYQQERLNALIVLDQVDNPQEYGVAVFQDRKIINLVEKPKTYVSNMAIVGVYIFDKNIYSAIEKIKPSWRNELEITDAIQEMIRNNHRVGYGKLNRWWKDTGMPSDMLAANQKLLAESSPVIEGYIDKKSQLTGKVTIGKGTTLIGSTIMGPVNIAENCKIKNAYIGPYCSIGENCEIENTEIENSIIMENNIIKNIEKRIANSLIAGTVEIIASKMPRNIHTFILGDRSKIKIT